MTAFIRRREFITLLGGAALSPLPARAQQSFTPRVGWLSFASPESSPALPFFQQGLADAGYVEGRNLVIEYRWARSHPELFPTLAVELVQSRVSVIAAVVIQLKVRDSAAFLAQIALRKGATATE